MYRLDVGGWGSDLVAYSLIRFDGQTAQKEKIMKKLFTTTLLCATLAFGAFGLTGCAAIQDFLNNSDTVSQVALTQGDQQALNTIGEDFTDYFEADETLDAETLDLYQDTVRDWATSGSTWETYTVVVGTDLDGPYVVYFEADEALEQSDRNARFGNIEAWSLNLESRFGPLGGEETTE